MTKEKMVEIATEIVRVMHEQVGMDKTKKFFKKTLNEWYNHGKFNGTAGFMTMLIQEKFELKAKVEAQSKVVLAKEKSLKAHIKELDRLRKQNQELEEDCEYYKKKKWKGDLL